ncbi:MAG: ABC transporter permease [Chloroflexi bacterium]|nr:ABC transporter permease [Chloroflexota bacterium]
MAGLLARYVVLAGAVVLLNFLLPRFLPGDPLDFGTDEGVDPSRLTLTAEGRARMVEVYRLDQPLPRQFVGYLSDLGRLDFGRSIGRGTRVADLIAQRLPWTLGLMGVTAVLSSLLGLVLGLVAAWRGGRIDATIVGVATSLAALPELLVALGLLVTLAVGAGWFPLYGGQTPFAGAAASSLGGTAAVANPFATPETVTATVTSAGPGLLATALDILWHLTLPALALLISTTAAFVLVARGTVRAELAQPYLTVARSKGLDEWRILRTHLLPNAALPLVTLFGLRVGQILGGAVVVERVFAIPGLGLFAYEAIRARDYPILQAVFLIASLFVLAVQLTLDLISRALASRHAG